MRTVIAGAAAVAVLALPAVPAGAAKHPQPVRCKNVNYEAADGYGVYSSTVIRATRVRCSLARRVAHVDPSAVAGRGDAPRRFRSHGFVCRGHRTSARTVPFRCTRSTPGTITFTWTTR